MFLTRYRIQTVGVALIAAAIACLPAMAHELKIVIPRHSKLTPVQRLNQEGVRAVRSRNYEKAEALFYKAYLYDPSDPFTLNNLGYVAELRGNLADAEKFYKLAGEQSSDATIAMSSQKQLRGKPMLYAIDTLQNLPMRVNRSNVEAVELLSEGHPFEAVDLLQQVLPIDPRNPFTLNNLGVAEEATGDFDSALRYYDEAAETGSKEPMVVTLNKSWRGRPVSQAAAESARLLRRRMAHMNMDVARARMLNLRGVAEANQNNWAQAQHDFLEAFRLNPGSAFSMNNRAFVAERAGDWETAQYYYSAAQRAPNAGEKVGLATRVFAQGHPLALVASDNTSQVTGQLNTYKQRRREEQGPVELIPRNGSANSTQPQQPQPQPHQ